MQQLDSAIEIDEEADAAYVRVSPDRVATTREVAMNIIVDFDDSEHIVGVEVLSLGQQVGGGDRISYLRGLVAGLKLRPIQPAA